MTFLKICQNDRCTNFVSPSKNPGVEKKYCGPRCRLRHNARMAYQRDVGSAGKGMIALSSDGTRYINRVIAPTEKLAHKRFLDHNDHCAVADGGRCPATIDDPNDRKKRCLVHAVLQDDWRQRIREDQRMGKPYRKTTTYDGRWLSSAEIKEIDMVIMEELDASVLPDIPVDMRIDDKLRQELIDEGTIVPLEQVKTSYDEDPTADSAVDIDMDIDEVEVARDVDSSVADSV
jgi:hypothetical protein